VACRLTWDNYNSLCKSTSSKHYSAVKHMMCYLNGPRHWPHSSWFHLEVFTNTLSLLLAIGWGNTAASLTWASLLWLLMCGILYNFVVLVFIHLYSDRYFLGRKRLDKIIYPNSETCLGIDLIYTVQYIWKIQYMLELHSYMTIHWYISTWVQYWFSPCIN